MKILLLGCDGQVGWELQRSLAPLGEVVALGSAGDGALHGDFSRPEALAATVRAVAPDVIVNAAAHTAVDRAESEPELARTINAAAPGVLAREARERGAWLVHYSTDYVFDGSGSAPWTEDAATGPLGVYGRTKLEGEDAIRASGCRHLIFRTSWVYAARGKNFYLTMKARRGQPLRVIDDQRGVPTSSRFLAENTLLLINKNIEGVLHLVPSGATTWYGFARAILGEQADITPIRSSEYKTAARRPANSVLDNRKAQALLGKPLPDWRAVFAAVR